MWNIQFDANYDIVYIFVAKIKIIDSQYDKGYNDFDFETANTRALKNRVENIYNALKVLNYKEVDITINI